MIRRATPAEAGRLASFARELFETTFAAANDPAHLAEYLDRAFGESQQRSELDDPAITTWIDEDDAAQGEWRAYAQTRHNPAEPHRLELKRFYVAPAWQGRGTAGALMAHCIAEARAAGASEMWLTVWEGNPRATRFYERVGFRPIGRTTFWMGPDPQEDAIMALPLG
jgi:diamine N-acetyltransferase